MKKIFCVVLTAVMLMLAVGCGCKHEWKDATCSSVMTCELCGETKGVVGDHTFVEATCDMPKTCEICKLQEGDALGHNYIDATMESQKICSRCGHIDGEKLKLSDSCDKVLAFGYDAENNYYELVANEKEDYIGTTIEIGIIKNDKWLIELTKNSPFLDDTGALYGASGDNKGSIYDENVSFSYIGAGCFIHGGIIWNVNINQAYSPYKSIGYNIELSIGRGSEKIINNEGIFLLRPYRVEGNYKLLDVKTMTVTDIDLVCVPSSPNRIDHDCVYAYSEGLFAVIQYVEENNSKNGFYDITGKKIIDLSKYDLVDVYRKGGLADIEWVQLFFKDGKCSFNITNDQGTKYTITIDKSGNVIDSIKRD